MTDAVPAWSGDIAPDDLYAICQQVREGGGRLVALWGSDARIEKNCFMLHVTLMTESGLICLNVKLSAVQPVYPDISRIFPAANRMQRAAYDMLGLYAQEGHDHRKWLRHASWHSGSFPLRKDFDGSSHLNAPHPNPLPPAGEGANVHSPAENGIQTLDDYAFVQVEGQGVHEIPVGPVHAGIIEPGHFRFSIIGERVLRLEERLGYVHKGTEKRFESMSLQQGAKLVGRVSGDSTVAYAWAYAMAAESIANIAPTKRALWLRALLLERERVANHLGDLGYLGNDVALAFGFAQFWILKEQVLRNNAKLFGHRYLMDKIVPGGGSANISAEGKRIIEEECAMLQREVSILRGIYDEHAGLQDRFISTGTVTPKLADQLGLCGLAGRASAQAWDARVQFPCAPYDKLDVRMATYRNGDVAARAIVRFDELFESLRLQREILANMIYEEGEPTPLEKLPANGFGIGMVEGWRGEVMVAIHTDGEGKLARVHPHDPSWQNWPLLEHAIIDNIVPDFPLINKSFNLSYSGQDL
ncbi:MAG: NADH-quinone oxidoreductase subunit C [Sideroxydans sp.]|nr:NADH-quinone oxidoreductase subunit C [Sideroxydans sp.]